MSFNIPILLIAYNRADFLRSALRRLEKIHPSNVYLFCDGSTDPHDMRVKEVHALAQSCKWVKKKFISEKNLGCKHGVSSAIDWIFSEQEKAIILEDDVEVDLSFFSFANILLDKYSEDDRIGMIAAVNGTHVKLTARDSYFFSRYASVWGWATWKRSWENYRKTEQFLYEIYRSSQYAHFLAGFSKKKKLLNALKCVEGKIDTWDYIWNLSFDLFNTLSIVPDQNLSINHGFGKMATHTRIFTDAAFMKLHSMKFPLIHPAVMCENILYEKKINQTNTKFSMAFQALRRHVLKIK